MLKVDRAMYEVRVECDGEAKALGCQVAANALRPTRKECVEALARRGWVWIDRKWFCRLCARRRERNGPLGL
jgi:hypothetical protein